MVAVVKQDSNATGLRYAEEDSLKTLSGDEVWRALEPNSYNDFGGQLTLLARNPINRSRQRKKGAITDLDASGGFNMDLTQDNAQDILQGFFFASLRKKGEEPVTAVDLDTTNPDEYECASTAGFLVGSLIKGFNFTNSGNNGMYPVTVVTSNTSVEVATGTLTAEASPPATAMIKVVGHQFATGDLTVDFTSSSLPALVTVSQDLTLLNLTPGELIYIGDTANAAYSFAIATGANGFARVLSVAAHRIVLDKTHGAISADDSAAAKTVRIFFGTVLKNELDTLIVRRTYSLERSLGAPDTSSTDQEYEYLDGSVPNQVTFNVGQADKINMDMSFVSCDHVQVAAGLQRAGSRPSLTSGDAFNTSVDFSDVKLAVASDTDSHVTPLFAYFTDLKISINNNASPAKAVGVVGAFDVTAGTFEVDGSLEAYFSTVSSIAAVRNNSDVTLHFVAAKANKGVGMDLPLIALGDGRLRVEQDQAIKIPLNTAAAQHPVFNHTALIVWWDYLPDVAMS